MRNLFRTTQRPKKWVNSTHSYLSVLATLPGARYTCLTRYHGLSRFQCGSCLEHDLKKQILLNSRHAIDYGQIYDIS